MMTKFLQHKIYFNNIFRTFSTSEKDVMNNKPANILPINIIPITKSSKAKVNTIKVWIDFMVTKNFDDFCKALLNSSKLKPGVDYSLLIKISKNNSFLTIDKKQHHFSFDSINDYTVRRLFDKIEDRLNDMFEEYNYLEYSCDSLLLEFRPVKIESKLKLLIDNIESVKKEYPDLDIKRINQDLDFFGQSIKDRLGTLINSSIIDGKLLFANLNIDDLDTFLENFNKNISNDESSDFFVTSSTEFYIVKRLNRYYIISINYFNNNDVIIKRCFNIHGDIVSKIKDIDNHNNTFTREHRNSITVYKGNSIISSIRNISLTPIKDDLKIKGKEVEKNFLPNSRIGTLDLETYEIDGQAKCFAIGFYTNEFKETKTYYINKDLNSTMLIHNCLTEMLKPRYNNNIYYVHNLGGFDAAFIIKALIDFNNTEEGIKNPYIHDVTTRDNNILRLVIKRKVNNRFVNVKLQDSVAILPRTLRSLGKDYQVDVVKSFFPYDFCTKDTLFYVGKTPSINYYSDLPEPREKFYSEELYKEEWDLQKETLKYLDSDLISLCQVLVKVNKILHLKFDIQMTESLTISGLAMKIFIKHHYNDENKPIPLVNNRMIWDDIYQSYYGGRVEVYNPHFKATKNKKLYYYDVNSLYPFASLNPMPGLDCKFIEKFGDIEKFNLESLFGFFYCKIKSSDNYIGLLPKRSEEGRLTFPNGEWYGWYFSGELQYAKERGYEIDVIKGYKFNAINDVFTSFVSTIIDMKINATNPSERNIAKLILNSLIGKFGMDFLKSVTKLLDAKTHDLISVTRVLKNSIELDEDLFLDTFKTGIDKEICEAFGVDYIKALNLESISETTSIRTYNTVSIPIAAATLSYARIHMNKIIMYILDKGGKIFYTDTDSIVTDLKLPDDFVHPKELGKLKLEHEIVEGYFITDKTYAFINTNGELIKRAKGVDSSKFILDDYKEMYKLKPINNATKIIAKRDYALGSVVITTKNNIKLNVENYTKRIRTFKNKKWIGTIPLMIKDIYENWHLSMINLKEWIQNRFIKQTKKVLYYWFLLIIPLILFIMLCYIISTSECINDDLEVENNISYTKPLNLQDINNSSFTKDLENYNVVQNFKDIKDVRYSDDLRYYSKELNEYKVITNQNQNKVVTNQILVIPDPFYQGKVRTLRYEYNHLSLSNLINKPFIPTIASNEISEYLNTLITFNNRCSTYDYTKTLKFYSNEYINYSNSKVSNTYNIEDLLHTIVSYKLESRGLYAFFNTHDLLIYSKDFLLDKCNKYEIKLSTTEYFKIIKEIANFMNHNVEFHNFILRDNITYMQAKYSTDYKHTSRFIGCSFLDKFAFDRNYELYRDWKPKNIDCSSSVYSDCSSSISSSIKTISNYDSVHKPFIIDQLKMILKYTKNPTLPSYNNFDVDREYFINHINRDKSSTQYLRDDIKSLNKTIQDLYSK